MAPCKLYAHIDEEGKPPFTLPVAVARPEEMQFGTVKQAILTEYANQFPENAVDYQDYCFWNSQTCPIADKCPVALHAWEYNDFFLRPIPEEMSKDSAMADSHQKKGELSYYYAHDRGSRGLISKPQTFAPAEPPKKIQAPVNSKGYNTKQSPFGTDIVKYETITSYSWEDHDSDTVKVWIPLDGVGKLPKEDIEAKFGERQFELLIRNYQGKNLRFACSKTHSDVDPEKCKYMVRGNKVTLVLRKAKEKDIWFDLFKKKAIGDNDDP